MEKKAIDWIDLRNKAFLILVFVGFCFVAWKIFLKSVEGNKKLDALEIAVVLESKLPNSDVIKWADGVMSGKALTIQNGDGNPVLVSYKAGDINESNSVVIARNEGTTFNRSRDENEKLIDRTLIIKGLNGIYLLAIDNFEARYFINLSSLSASAALEAINTACVLSNNQIFVSELAKNCRKAEMIYKGTLPKSNL